MINLLILWLLVAQVVLDSPDNYMKVWAVAAGVLLTFPLVKDWRREKD